MPRSRKKNSIRNFFLLTQNFIFTILSPSKRTFIKKYSWQTLVINERDPWPVFEVGRFNGNALSYGLRFLLSFL